MIPHEADVELNADELAVLGVALEINEGGGLGSLEALCRRTRLPEAVAKAAVKRLVGLGFLEIPRQ